MTPIRLGLSLVELIDEADPAGRSMRHGLRELSMRVGQLEAEGQTLVSALVGVLEKQAGAQRAGGTSQGTSAPP